MTAVRFDVLGLGNAIVDVITRADDDFLVLHAMRKGSMTLIDEALTPDSSRFWPIDSYKPGISPPSFDKQFVRDYLESLHWDKKPPAPRLPPEIISRTSGNYLEALKLLAS